MNRPSQVIRSGLASPPSALGEKGGEAFTRVAGRSFIMALYGSLRSIRMYPIENAVVQKSLAELSTVTEELRQAGGAVEFRVSGEFIFVNSTRLRLDLDNYTTFSYLLALCRACGVGVLRVNDKPSARDWIVFLSFLLAPQGDGPEMRLDALRQRLDSTGIVTFELSPPARRRVTGKSRNKRRKRPSARSRSRCPRRRKS